jgi:hypothetical protein
VRIYIKNISEHGAEVSIWLKMIAEGSWRRNHNARLHTFAAFTKYY